MKRLPLCTLLFIFIMYSCNDENLRHEFTENYSHRAPQDSINPYDLSGRLHSELTETFIAEDFDITDFETVIKQVETLANANSDFRTLKTSSYETPDALRMLYLTDNQPGRIPEIISMSSLTPKAKISLTNFYSNLVWFQEHKQSPDEIISFIITYEHSIPADKDFTENDRRILLTTTSISRASYGMQKRKVKRRDRDWELSIGNFATTPASNTTAEAITMSVVAGLITNR